MGSRSSTWLAVEVMYTDRLENVYVSDFLSFDIFVFLLLGAYNPFFNSRGHMRFRNPPVGHNQPIVMLLCLQDEQRVTKRFSRAHSRGISITKESVSYDTLLKHLSYGPVIVLTNSRLLTCDICKLNKVGMHCNWNHKLIDIFRCPLSFESVCLGQHLIKDIILCCVAMTRPVGKFSTGIQVSRTVRLKINCQFHEGSLSFNAKVFVLKLKRPFMTLFVWYEVH